MLFERILRMRELLQLNYLQLEFPSLSRCLESHPTNIACFFQTFGGGNERESKLKSKIKEGKKGKQIKEDVKGTRREQIETNRRKTLDAVRSSRVKYRSSPGELMGISIATSAARVQKNARLGGKKKKDIPRHFDNIFSIVDRESFFIFTKVDIRAYTYTDPDLKKKKEIRPFNWRNLANVSSICLRL